MTLFEPSERTRVVEEPGAVDRLGAIAAELGARVLVVTDPGVVAAGHAARAEAALERAGLVHARFAGVTENPTSAEVDRCLSAAEDFGPDLLCGVGGGSPIDVAKGVNFLLSCGGRMRDYRGRATATGPLLPLIAVPTTAGTGTEVQSFALIVDPETHQKMACGDPRAAPRVAVLDATLTLSMPPFVTACTGLDAIGHAVESAVTTAGNPTSSRYAHEAFRLAAASFPRVMEAPDDVAARGRMLRAAALAGLAIEHSMLGAAHSMANPLTARFDLAHGQAVGTCLPAVVRFNAGSAAARDVYADLARAAGLAAAAATPGEAAEALAAALEGFVAAGGLPASLGASGVEASHWPVLAAEAAEQWTARFNPRTVDADAFERLFAAAAE